MRKNFILYFLIITFACLPLASVYSQNVDTVAVVEPAEVDGSEDDESEEEKVEEERFQQRTASNPFTSSQRYVPEKTYNDLKKDDAFWYADGPVSKNKTKPLQPIGNKGDTGKIKEPPKVKENSNEQSEEDELSDYTPMGQRKWFKTLMLILAIVGFAAIIGWYLASSNVGIFRKKDKRVTNEASDEEMPEDIFSINYVDEVDKAVIDGNYPLAIRLQYLRLLKNMAERKVIAYKQDKTNFDYLSEVHSASWYNQFFRITRHYEFSWYGKFEVSPEAYHIVNMDFTELNKKINL